MRLVSDMTTVDIPYLNNDKVKFWKKKLSVIHNGKIKIHAI